MHKNYSRLLSTAVFILCILSSAFASAESFVICHNGLELESISRKTLLNIYTLKMKYWQNGTPVRVVTFEPKSEEHREFTKSTLGILAYQLQRKWDRLIFSGRGVAPIFVADYEAMVERVRTTPGAIGYVSSALDDESIRQLQIVSRK